MFSKPFSFGVPAQQKTSIKTSIRAVDFATEIALLLSFLEQRNTPQQKLTEVVI